MAVYQTRIIMGLACAELGGHDRTLTIFAVCGSVLSHWVIYRERDAMVQVLAIAHNRRRPGYWLGRVF